MQNLILAWIPYWKGKNKCYNVLDVNRYNKIPVVSVLSCLKTQKKMTSDLGFCPADWFLYQLIHRFN